MTEIADSGAGAEESRKNLSFEQAEGVVPLPVQLSPREISQELRALLWALIFEELEEDLQYSSMGGGPSFGDAWSRVLRDRHVFREHRMLDEFPSPLVVISEIKTIVSSGNYIEVFGLLQWIIRHRDCPPQFYRYVDGALQRARAPYRVVDRTIMPVGSEAEAETIARVFANPSAREFNGARVHLRHAGEYLTAGEWANSIRESVHSVEAVVRLLEPGCKLDAALTRLEKAGKLHKAVKQGFSSLYGFTSDEEGIRHPLLERDAAEVDETDALYMFGACAAFITYLIGKGRKANLLQD